MNLAGLLTTFATGTYTVTRTARGSVLRGRVQTGTQTTVDITASVSPASGRDIDRLPQGQTSNGAKTLFTRTQLYTASTGGSYEADHISVDGQDHQISHVEAWKDPRSGDTVYKCIATEA